MTFVIGRNTPSNGASRSAPGTAHLDRENTVFRAADDTKTDRQPKPASNQARNTALQAFAVSARLTSANKPQALPLPVKPASRQRASSA